MKEWKDKKCSIIVALCLEKKSTSRAIPDIRRTDYPGPARQHFLRFQSKVGTGSRQSYTSVPVGFLTLVPDSVQSNYPVMSRTILPAKYPGNTDPITLSVSGTSLRKEHKS